jgi:MFS family permease
VTPSTPSHDVDERRRVRGGLTTSILDGAFYALMMGASESYLGAFAVALGHDDAALAALVSVPVLFGALAQLSSRTLVTWVGSRKRLVVGGALLQALSHLGLLAIVWAGTSSFWALLAVKIAYWTSGMVLAPAWNAWMARLTEGVDRGRFFSLRSAVVQGAVLVSYAAGGFYLEAGRTSGALLSHFAALFAFALVARLVSVVALARQHDPGSSAPDNVPPGFVPQLRAAVSSSRLQIVALMVLFHFGAHIAGPFFTPYMLKTLQLNLVDFMILSGVAILAKAATFPVWSVFARKAGLRLALFLSLVGVALVSTLWARVPTFSGLLWVQVLSGVAWAGFEFASFQMLLRSSPEPHRVAFFGLATSLAAVAQLCGSFAGSLLIARFDLGYELTFVVSGFVRVSPALLLLSPVVKMLAVGPLPRVFFRVLSVRPEGGIIRQPILGSGGAGASAQNRRAPGPRETPPQKVGASGEQVR